ncbi:MAG: hypothetical protein ACYCPS_02255 [Candidatus Saccharimonadales bacterium]
MPKNQSEFIGEAPDNFYINEMKREVGLALQGDIASEVGGAKEFFDTKALAAMIVHADTVAPSEYPKLINSNPSLSNGLWNYFAAAHSEAATRRGYGDDDIRGLTVSLASAGIRLARVVDGIKRTCLGFDASTAFTNSLTSLVFMSAAVGLATNNANLINTSAADFTSRLADDAFKRTAMTKRNESWSWAKVFTVVESLSNVFTAYNILKQLPDIGETGAHVLQLENKALGDASEALRVYTPKPAVGEIEGTDVQTLFVDQDVSDHMIISGKKYTVIKLFPGIDLTSSNVSLSYAVAHKHEGGLSKRIKVEDLEQMPPHTDMVLYDQKKITILGTPLADFAKSVGMSGQAELLTSMLLIQNFDLTVPVYVVDVANQDAESSETTPDTLPIVDKMRRLVLARTRVLKVLGDEVGDAIRREDDNEKAEHNEGAKKDIVGYLRRLPTGYRASQEARQLCREQLDRDIPDGFTYVKKHQRGSLESNSKGHRMVQANTATGRVAVSTSVRH